jgi:hypothetical protein
MFGHFLLPAAAAAAFPLMQLGGRVPVVVPVA